MAIVQLLLATRTPTPTVTLGEFLISLIPWLLILGFVIVVFWGTRRQYRINAQHVERMRLHMAAVEAKLDRLIELSERRSGG
jgi:Tfp pilus assembly protein PilW